MKNIKIYLGDLTYESVSINCGIPLNVAYIAQYAKTTHSDSIDVKIFKSPSELEEAINTEPPDVLGLSSYSWNERLSHLFFNVVKNLKSETVTVMGGPNIRADFDGIRDYLLGYPDLDYYIPFEGEQPFSNLVGSLLGKAGYTDPPQGCARIVDNDLQYVPFNFDSMGMTIDLPSPYMSGILTPFLKNPNLIPLLESSRGCPFKCIYCTWGNNNSSRIRTKDLDLLYQEIDFVFDNDAGQTYWIFCDSNFGIKERDVEIAKKLQRRADSDKRRIRFELYQSKNSSKRNILIADILNDNQGYVALQSTDPDVLKACGRGNIQLDHLKAQISYYKEKKLQVTTDLLLGLPDETATKHFNSIKDVFDLGFDRINPLNIRLLQGSVYETLESRTRYGIQTKFRPIYGAYGIFDDQIVFEIEESVRATNSMSELELEHFKLLHWLIYFAWNSGSLKPMLKFGQIHGINPAIVLDKLCSSESQILLEIFSRMRKASQSEWFDSREDMIKFYEKRENFDSLINSFAKLNFLWIAELYQNPKVISAMISELAEIIYSSISSGLSESDRATWKSVLQINTLLVCDNILESTFSKKLSCKSDVLKFITNDDTHGQSVEIEIYREQDDVDFCMSKLYSDGEHDLSTHNFVRFLEVGGINMLINKIRITHIQGASATVATSAGVL